MDAILENAPLSTLLALRATCSVFRDAIDGLARHLVLVDGVAVTPNIPTAAIPLTESAGPTSAQDDDISSLTLSFQRLNLNAVPNPFRICTINAVRVLDLIGHMQLDSFDTGAFTHIPVVRTWASTRIDIRRRDCVDPTTLVIFDWPDPSRTQSVRASITFPPPVGRSLRKVVLNATLGSSWPTPIGSQWFLQHDVEEVVFIFHAHPPSRPTLHSSDGFIHWLPYTIASLIRMSQRSWNQDRRLIKITFVNADILPRHYFAGAVATFWTFPTPKIRTYAGWSLKGLTSFLWPKEFRFCPPQSPFQLLTLEEYERMTGTVRYRIETDDEYQVTARDMNQSLRMNEPYRRKVAAHRMV